MTDNTIFNTDISKDKARDSGMAMVLILLILGLYLDEIIYFKYAVLSLLLTMTAPMAYKYIAIIWFAGSNILGFVVSKIILALIFFVFVFPVGFMRKILGKDSLKLKQFKKSKSSVMVERNHMYGKKDIDKPF